MSIDLFHFQIYCVNLGISCSFIKYFFCYQSEERSLRINKITSPERQDYHPATFVSCFGFVQKTFQKCFKMRIVFFTLICLSFRVRVLKEIKKSIYMFMNLIGCYDWKTPNYLAIILLWQLLLSEKRFLWIQETKYVCLVFKRSLRIAQFNNKKTFNWVRII